MTAHDIWDFIGSVSGKMCVIDHHSVTYVRTKCAVICFDSTESLDAIVGTTPILKDTNLCWFHLVLAKYAKCGKLGHTSLGCVVGGKVSSGLSLHRVLSDTDKSRLAAIYAKQSAPVARPVSFGGLSWAKIASKSSFPPLSGRNVSAKSGSSSEMEPFLPVLTEVNNRFVTLEHSLASLAEQMGKLAKRLDNQGADIVMSKGSGAATSGEVVLGVMSFDVSLVSKLEDSMKCLMETVLGLSVKIDSFGIVNKFDGVWVFTSGLESGYLGAGVVVVINSSLVRHVCRISEVPGWLLSIKLLFKNKLLVSILGLYASASLAVQFSQAGEVNSLIAKAVNESFFIVLGGNFNENSSCKYASFKKCLDLGLVNSLAGSPASKLSTWANSRGVMKTIDYVFVSPNLVNAIVNREVLDVSKHFDMDYQAVSMAVGLGGLLDMQLNFLHRQANKN
ncbi:hypothetical protein G9A89_022498 [Geosiphon pyriformis]|nr:hypothetical protein G9A89_022498 [Geosiphon pyriformis]